MEVKQFKYGESNFSYILYSGHQAIIIDGGAVDAIIGFIESQNMEVAYIINTHMHSDHTPGNKRLVGEYGCQFLNPGQLARKKKLAFGKTHANIHSVPGHTMDSILIEYQGNLICGDTLFNGTVGNCYTGKYELYFKSLQKILTFPPESRIFAGHDLVDYALGVAVKIDPNNPFIEDYKKSLDNRFVFSTLQQELQVNPFIRFNDPALDEFRSTLDMPLDTPYLRWRAMMSVH